MTRRFFKYLFYFPIAFVFFACNEENYDLQTKEQIKTVMDSISSSNIIACYHEDVGFSVLVFNTNEKRNARRLTYRKGYPVYTDSLIYKKHDEFRSQKFNTTYLIRDSTVLSINYVKIIHPSSNWQGQTPWQTPYITTYNRIDNKTK